jgi:CoA-transferase family III
VTAPSAARAAADRLHRELEALGEPLPVGPLPGSAADDWRASGADELTGYAGGPPLNAPGAPASAVRGALAVAARCAVAGSRPVAPLPGVELLSQRARSAGLRRNAPFSVGGRFRAVRARDGWVGLSLARSSDLDLLPALVESDVRGEPFTTVADWAAQRPVADVVDRLVLLGLPGGPIPPEPAVPPRPGVRVQPGPPRLAGPSRPVVVDFTALWAGPLCAHLLGRLGARVVKVESTTRPDGARRGNPAFFATLHAGHEKAQVDFGSEAGRRRLQELVDQADVVLEASRPRALARLGLDAAAQVARGAVWVSITAHGRDQPDRVGFGDDVAATAGLVVHGPEGPYPVGDAIADPLAGVHAAAAAAFALHHRRGALIDVSMVDVARWAAWS